MLYTFTFVLRVIYFILSSSFSCIFISFVYLLRLPFIVTSLSFIPQKTDEILIGLAEYGKFVLLKIGKELSWIKAFGIDISIPDILPVRDTHLHHNVHILIFIFYFLIM